MTGKRIAEKLHGILNSIMGAINNPEILEKLSLHGYTRDKILLGKELVDRVNHWMTVQVNEYGKQYALTEDQEAYLSTTYAKYMVVVKVGRVAFKKQHNMLTRLDIVGARPRSLSGWLRSARILYTNLLETPEALIIINNFGIPTQQIEEGLQDIEKIEELHVKQLGGKSVAQQSTQERDKAFDELCDWYSDFRAIARIAFYDNPQLLEAMGITKK
jgi:hypothetical protein